MSSNSDFYGSIRVALTTEKVELEHQLDELGYGSSELEYDVNFADSSQVTAERGEVEALGRQLKETLEEVLAAIAKIEAGTYGVCEGCQMPIDPVRLEAMPTARFCLGCMATRVRR